MPIASTLRPLIAYLRKTAPLSSAVAVLSWDQETYMPSGGASARAETIAALEGMAHARWTGAAMRRLLARFMDIHRGVPNETIQDEDTRALLREVWWDYDRAIRLPVRFVQKRARATAIALQAWEEARKKNDFPLFAPHLQTVIDLKIQEADYLGYSASRYDALLDQYEPGMTVARIANLFQALAARLTPLLHRIMTSSTVPDEDFLHAHYPADRQVDFGKQVLSAMGYDLTRGRQDFSAHPFTTSFHPTDVRITTRVNERDPRSCLFSLIHEGGHALYDQGLETEAFGTPLGEALSMGIHESQSRLWENGVGKSRAFWEHFYPRLQQAFPTQLEGISLERFYAAVNRVCPSPIRVEADELTYSFHIMIRFEIERALIDEELPVSALPTLFREKMKAALGIVPDSDAEGVLQDVHWAHGAVGYFPSYILGNLYAAQLLRQAERSLPTLHASIQSGELLPLTRWLNENVHRHGRRYPSDILIQRITGEPLNPAYFVSYLEEKLGAIYGTSVTWK